MNILVTGSSGLIGSYIVKRFIEVGHTLRTLDRLAQPRGQDWEHLPGDIRDLALVRRAAQGMDAIVHLAAIPNDFSGLPEDVLDTNIHGTWNVLLAAFEVGIKRVVYFSSINALGHAEPTHPAMYLPIDDDVPHHPAHPYFLSKHIGEELCQSYVTLSGGTAISLRPTYVMRPSGEETDPWWNFVPVEQRLEMMKDDYWTFVDVRDVAEAALLSLDRQPRRPSRFPTDRRQYLAGNPCRRFDPALLARAALAQGHHGRIFQGQSSPQSGRLLAGQTDVRLATQVQPALNPVQRLQGFSLGCHH